MNVLSLFDGMSVGQLALKRAGVTVDKYFASEIEKHSIAVTLSNFPQTIQLGDVKGVKSSDLPKIDLLIGGSPCQSFSRTISTNTGFDGKSALFFEYLRLLEELKPKYFFLENVVMKKEWEDVITQYLGVEPVEISSSRFSAQNRPRVYWTNIPYNRLLPDCKDVLGDILEQEVDEKFFYKEDFTFHGFDKVVCATLHIKGHDILKRVNSPYHKCHTLTAVCGGNQQKKVLVKNRVRKLTPLEYERLQCLPDNYSCMVSNAARYKMIGNSWTVSVIQHIMEGLNGNPI